MSAPEFTGERFIPGQGGAEIAYEHFHRYLFASRLADGKRVLDLACGSGYGASMLARTAARVIGIDLDREPLRHVAGTSPANLGLVAADGTRLPVADRSFDVVTAFEVIEHLSAPEALVSEVSRVVKREGLALISTPNKTVYSDARAYCNPYHVREFYPDEFLQLLRAHFPEVRDFRQQVRAGSLIEEAESGRKRGEAFLDSGPFPGRSGREPMYLLAVCGFSEGACARASRSALIDTSDALIEEWSEQLRAALAEIAKLNREIESLGEWGRRLEADVALRDESLRRTMLQSEAEVAARDGVIRSVRDEMVREIAARDGVLEELRAEFDSRTEWAFSLERVVGLRDETIRRVSDDLARIHSSFFYRLLHRLRLLP